jgi:valyl-tRNA synthetase
MKKAGLVIKTEPYRTTIPRSQRGGEIVEPMISEQWFVQIEPLAKAALEAVKDGRIRIVPERFEKIYYNWMENIRDWCISRQLWWGHRIPVWYCPDGHMTVTREDPTECGTCGSTELRQDEDVLDTWFSSGLWPFSTLGWPEETPDYKYFYPTSYMETGYDILFFWVARMIMSGLEYTGKIPFHTVYLHGTIRDEYGRRMSKTYGNGIDPLIVMDEYGTDALRYTLLVGSTPGNDMNLAVKKVESNRNFTNKLWNAGRFVISAVSSQPIAVSEKADYSLADSWIWAKLQQLIRDAERQFQNFQYGQAGQQIYDFLWSDFADWYVEIAKLELAEGGPRAARAADALASVFEIILRLLHPFAPFVTEELWGHLRSALKESTLKDVAKDWPEALIIAKWPEPRQLEGWEADKIADFELIQEIVRSIRNLRAEKGVAPSKRIAAGFSAGSKAGLLQEQARVIASLSGLDEAQLTIAESLKDKPKDSVTLVIGSIEIHIPLAGMVDLAEEKSRLEKELRETESHIERLEKLLGSDFANKAPAPVVQKERDKLAGYRETAGKIKAQLK